MKMTVVSNRLSDPASFRMACDIRRACRPTWESPISPSISARGTSAATESTTNRSSAPDRTSMSPISRACSPESGCDTKSSSMFTPKAWAYVGSSACSASTKAAMPPWRWASAMTCRHTVVLPEPSGPNTSTMRPRGIPPTPSAMSRDIDPVGITEMPCPAGCSPRRITAPFPYCFSICVSATSSILSRSTGDASFRLKALTPAVTAPSGTMTGRTVATGSDINYTSVVRIWCVVRISWPGYSNVCSSSTTPLPQGERPQGLVAGGRALEVAPVQGQRLHRERLAGHVNAQRLFVQRGLLPEPRHGEVGGEGPLLRRELAFHQPVECAGQSHQPGLRVVQPRPQDPRAPRRRERTQLGQLRLERLHTASRLGHLLLDPAAQPRVDAPQEFQRDVPALRSHPPGPRERVVQVLDGVGQRLPKNFGHVDGDEQPQRPRLRPRLPVPGHLLAAGQDLTRCWRYRLRRSSADCSAHRTTWSRSPGARNPRTSFTSAASRATHTCPGG